LSVQAATCATFFSRSGAHGRSSAGQPCSRWLSGLFFIRTASISRSGQLHQLVSSVVVALGVVGRAMGGWGLGAMFLTYIWSRCSACSSEGARTHRVRRGALCPHWTRLDSMEPELSFTAPSDPRLHHMALSRRPLWAVASPFSSFFSATPRGISAPRRQCPGRRENSEAGGRPARSAQLATTIASSLVPRTPRSGCLLTICCAPIQQDHTPSSGFRLLEPEFSQYKHDPDNPAGRYMKTISEAGGAEIVRKKISAHTIIFSILRSKAGPASVTGFRQLGLKAR